MIDISKRIKEARKKLGFSNQQKFADKLEVSLSTLQNYEQGKINIPHTFLEKLNLDFNINMNWLLTGKGEVFLDSDDDIERLKNIVKGDNNAVIKGKHKNNIIILNNGSNPNLEKSILNDIIEKLSNVHDDTLLNYIDSEITSLIQRIQMKEMYGSTFGN